MSGESPGVPWPQSVWYSLRYDYDIAIPLMTWLSLPRYPLPNLDLEEPLEVPDFDPVGKEAYRCDWNTCVDVGSAKAQTNFPFGVGPR